MPPRATDRWVFTASPASTNRSPTTLTDVMGDAACVHAGTPIAAIRRLFADHRVGGVVAVDDLGRPIGFVTPRDLVDEVAPTEPPARAQDVMMPVTFTLPEHAPWSLAARLMTTEGISHLIVVDRARRVVGTVSALQLVRAWLDEHD